MVLWLDQSLYHHKLKYCYYLVLFIIIISSITSTYEWKLQSILFKQNNEIPMCVLLCLYRNCGSLCSWVDVKASGVWEEKAPLYIKPTNFDCFKIFAMLLLLYIQQQDIDLSKICLFLWTGNVNMYPYLCLEAYNK